MVNLADTNETNQQKRIDLRNQHPDFEATAEGRVKSRDLYTGTEAVKVKKTAYLYKTVNESVPKYNLRLKRAVLDPFSEKIISTRQAIMFSKPQVRELPVELQVYNKDVDLNNTNADVFFHNVALNSQIAE